MTPQPLGLSLRILRMRRGLTLKQLAERTELSVSYLSEIERGITEPTIATLRCIAAAYDRVVVIALRRAP